MSINAEWFPRIGPVMVRLIQENLTAAKCGRIDFAEQEIVEQDSHENVNERQIGVDVGEGRVRVPMDTLTCVFLVREKDDDRGAILFPNFDMFVDNYVEPSAIVMASNADKLHLENIARASPRLLGTFNGGGFLDWFEMIQGQISGEPIAFVSPESLAELLKPPIKSTSVEVDGMKSLVLDDFPDIPIVMSQNVPELYTPEGATIRHGCFGSVNVIFNRNNTHFVCRPLGKFNSHPEGFESVTYTLGNISVQVRWGPYKDATRVDINMLVGSYIPEPDDIAAILT